MALTIEAGKYYRTSEGRKVRLIGPCECEGVKYFLSQEDGRAYSVFGGGRHGTEDQGGATRNQPSLDLIAEWTDETPHILYSTNGRAYDLTALEAPLALLPDDVLDALREWPHGLLILSSSGGWVSCSGAACIESTYRARPAPKVTEVTLEYSHAQDQYSVSWPDDFPPVGLPTVKLTFVDGRPTGAQIVVEAL